MKKSDVVEELQVAWGVEPPASHNLKMLKDLLREERETAGINIIQDPPFFNLKKDALIELARYEQVQLTGGETVAALQRKIQENRNATHAAAVVTDQIMKFGKHKNKMFSEIVRKDATYCQWALSTVVANPHRVHHGLKTFAMFYDKAAVMQALDNHNQKKAEEKHHIGWKGSAEMEQMKEKLDKMTELAKKHSKVLKAIVRHLLRMPLWTMSRNVLRTCWRRPKTWRN